MANALGGFLPPALVPPDGKEILLAGGARVDVVDGQGLFLTGSFQIGDGPGSYRERTSLGALRE